MAQDSLNKESNHIFSLIVAASPLWQPMKDQKDAFNFTTGILASAKLGNRSLAKLTMGILWDINKYQVTDIINGIYSYSAFYYIRIPICMDIYFTQRKKINPYFSYGISLTTTSNKDYGFYVDYAGWNNFTYNIGGGVQYKIHNNIFINFSPILYRFIRPVIYGTYEQALPAHPWGGGTSKTRYALHARNTFALMIAFSYSL